jgi:hypothetical protein
MAYVRERSIRDMIRPIDLKDEDVWNILEASWKGIWNE